MTGAADEQGWLLISVSTAGTAPTLRVQVWRKLRSLYVQQSVCLLPEREQTLRQVRRLLERLPAFRAELAAERARGRATYVEVEESEADLERFRSWMGKIAARDYFAAPAGAAPRAAIEDAAADLPAFEQSALAAEAPVDSAVAVRDGREGEQG